MSKTVATDDLRVVEDLRLQLRMDPDRTTWMLSSTFWKNRIGVQKRHLARVARVRALLNQHHIAVESGVAQFGKEPFSSKLTFTVLDVAPWPTGKWFAKMAGLWFESEAEVEATYLVPMLHQLGFEDGDINMQCNVTIPKGQRHETVKVDIAVFDGPEHTGNSPLLIIEAKKPTRGTTIPKNALVQAQSYAYWSGAPLWAVSDGNETVLFRHGLTGNAIEVLRFDRLRLADEWASVVKYMSRESVVDFGGSLRPLSTIT